MVKEVEFIVFGDVQGVGYRQYVAKVGRKLKLVGFVENLEDGTVRIHCKGEEKAVSEFRKLINVQRPEAAPLTNVENMEEKQLTQGTIKEIIFKEKYSDSNAEMAQGFSTGMNYMNLFRAESQSNFGKLNNTVSDFRAESKSGIEQINKTVNELKEETVTKFDHMDEKYDKISQGMFAVVASMEKRMEKTDKNIESLLKILAEKK